MFVLKMNQTGRQWWATLFDVLCFVLLFVSVVILSLTWNHKNEGDIAKYKKYKDPWSNSTEKDWYWVTLSFAALAMLASFVISVQQDGDKKKVNTAYWIYDAITQVHSPIFHIFAFAIIMFLYWGVFGSLAHSMQEQPDRRDLHHFHPERCIAFPNYPDNSAVAYLFIAGVALLPLYLYMVAKPHYVRNITGAFLLISIGPIIASYYAIAQYYTFEGTPMLNGVPDQNDGFLSERVEVKVIPAAYYIILTVGFLLPLLVVILVIVFMFAKREEHTYDYGYYVLRFARAFIVLLFWFVAFANDKWDLVIQGRDCAASNWKLRTTNTDNLLYVGISLIAITFILLVITLFLQLQVMYTTGQAEKEEELRRLTEDVPGVQFHL